MWRGVASLGKGRKEENERLVGEELLRGWTLGNRSMVLSYDNTERPVLVNNRQEWTAMFDLLVYARYTTTIEAGG